MVVVFATTYTISAYHY